MTAFLRGYLIGYLFWLSIALGSVAVLQVTALTDGRWGRAARSTWEAAAATMIPLAVLFLPLALGARHLYPWALGRPPSPYLTLPGFRFRAAVYFTAWAALARLVRRPAAAAASGAEASPALGAGLGLVIYFLTATFASIDWAMSLEPAWGSTAFGLIMIAGQGVAALSFGVLVPLPRPADDAARRDLGNLLLAFVMMWAYVSFSQYLIIWAGDIPREVRWYASRAEGPWAWVAAVLAGVQFAAPFALLLWRSVKRSPFWLAAIGAGLLAGRWLDLWWLTAPALSPRRLDGVLPSAAGVVLVGVPWLLLFNRERRRRAAWETAS